MKDSVYILEHSIACRLFIYIISIEDLEGN